MNKPLSNCCSAEMKVIGGVTKYFLCTACQKPCDPKPTAAYESTDPCLPDGYDRGYKDGRKQVAKELYDLLSSRNKGEWLRILNQFH